MTRHRGFQTNARHYAFALAVAMGGSAVAGRPAWGSVVTIEFVTIASPSPSNTLGALPVSQTAFEPGATLYIEVWAQTTHANGLSSVSLDLLFSSTVLNVGGITHTVLFGALTHGFVDNANGLVDDLSGSHLAACGAVGVAPNWARVAVLQTQAGNGGVALIQSRQTYAGAYGTAICGVGDVPPAQISFGTKSISIGSAAIPAVSAWGMILLALSLSITATAILRHRSLSRDTDRRSRRHPSVL